VEQEEEHNNMATTINHPYQTNVLSAAGSAEVLGRGSNSYTDTWSYKTSTLDELDSIRDWDKFSNFPTAVRTGNFVWVLYRIRSKRAIWLLIDVVPDPSVDRQFGNNIAYPEIPDHVKHQFDFTSNAAVYKGVGDIVYTDDTSRDGTPLYAFTLTDQNLNDTSTNGKTQSFFFSAAYQYNEIVYNPAGTGGFITTPQNRVPLLYGWGSGQYLLQDDNSYYNIPNTSDDFVYNLWAPFATKAQFDTLYGTEAEWIWRTRDSSHHVLFDQVYLGTGTDARTVVYNEDTVISPSGPRVYPFALPTFASNTLFKEIPGDTTGDGIDNTPSLEDALEVYAVATALVPGLDPTKCAGFPGDLIPGLDMSAINEKLNGVKAGIETAIASTGLLDLEKKLEGFKASIEDKFPKAVEVLNFVEDLAKLDPKELVTNLADDVVDLAGETVGNAIGDLKEKWKDTVEDVDAFVDGIVENITNFDICSTIGLQGKTGADGKLVKKPETPSIPDKDIEEPVQSSVVATQSRNTAQNNIQAATGITPAKEEDIAKQWNSTWETVRKDTNYIWAKYLGAGTTKEYEDNFNKFVSTPDYVKAREAVNRKQPIPLDAGRLEELKAGFKEVLVPLYNYRALKEKFVWSRERLHKYITVFGGNLNDAGKATYFPTPDYDISSMLKIGTYLVQPVGVIAPGNWLGVSHMDQANRDMLLKFQPQIVEATKKYFFSEEGIQLQLSIMASFADNWSEDIQKKIEEAINEGNEGDAVDDSISGTPPEEFKNVIAGNVEYSSDFRWKKRNQPIQPKLFQILSASAAEKNWSITVYSGGQDYKGTRGARRTGSIRHDGGFAADIRIYNDKGRRIHAASNSSKDIKELREFVLILLKNGITSIGADSDYMSGNLHVDIATNSPAACWGAKGSSYRRKYAPEWLTSAFDNRV